MKIYAKTDKGLVRETNQDTYSYGSFENGIFALVCDGMGGAAGGEIASSIAAKELNSRLSIIRPQMTVLSIKRIIDCAVDGANNAILAKANEQSSLEGMGTTAVIAVVLNNRFCLSNIGDSRAYLIENGRATQLTKDHSFVQELVDMGDITQEQAKSHPYKNVITRALGSEEAQSADFSVYDKTENSILLLCSDGLTNYVSDEDIAFICSNNDCETAVQKLIDTANANGGGDNITVVLVEMSEE